MKIFYFTHSYPYGKAVLWKSYELENLIEYFNDITIIPFCDQLGSEIEIDLPKNVKIHKPLISLSALPLLRVRLIKILLSKYFKWFLKDFFENKVFANKQFFLSWIIDSYNQLLLIENSTIQSLIQSNDKDTIWYFFWGRDPALIIPYLKRNFGVKVACRFHGYDLYKERNGGYIPFQQEIIRFSDLLLPCSEDGKMYLIKKLFADPDKIFVARLGARFKGVSKKNISNVLNIVSCSSCVSVKRIHLIIESLKKIDFPIIWTHIGDGPLFPSLIEEAKAVENDTCKINFMGFMPSKMITQYYINSNFDVFINVSESEGVPVSIMEAMSVGLPIIATDVGGTSEIVNSKVGYLIPKDSQPNDIANWIIKFHNLPVVEIEGFRNNSLDQFRCFCDADINAQKLSNKLLEFFKVSN